MDGTTAGQLALFEQPAPAKPRKRHGRWLTEIAAAARATATTPAFTAAVLDADQQWQPTRTNDGRADAGRFEEMLRPRLIDASETIGAQVAALNLTGPALGRLSYVLFTDPTTTRGGTAVYDVGMELAFDKAGVIRIPVNIKRSKSAAAGDEAVNLTTAFRVALGTGADDGRSLDLPRTRLGFWARRHKVGVQDYYLLCVEGGTEPTWHFQGLMTATHRGQLAATIHNTREKLRYRSSTETLADEFDINRAIAEQWGPGYRPSVLREQLLLAAKDAGASDDDLADLAGLLLDADDKALAKAVVAAVRTLERVQAKNSDGQ